MVHRWGCSIGGHAPSTGIPHPRGCSIGEDAPSVGTLQRWGRSIGGRCEAPARWWPCPGEGCGPSFHHSTARQAGAGERACPKRAGAGLWDRRGREAPPALKSRVRLAPAPRQSRHPHGLRRGAGGPGTGTGWDGGNVHTGTDLQSRLEKAAAAHEPVLLLTGLVESTRRGPRCRWDGVQFFFLLCPVLGSPVQER